MNKYPKYWLYEFGIKDACKYHKKLIAEGYYLAATTEEMASALTTTQIKEILLSVGLKTTGKKEDLIKRVIGANVEKQIVSKFQTQPYSLSPKGIAFLEENSHYIKLYKHKGWNINWEEYDKLSQNGKRNFYDVVWGIFNSRLMKTNDCGHAVYQDMYELLCEEGRKENALSILLKIIYIEANGITGYAPIQSYRYKLTKKQELVEKAFIQIQEKYIKELPKYKDIFTDNLIEQLFTWKLPITICDKKSFYNIIRESICGSINLDAINSNLTAIYKKNIVSIANNDTVCKLLGIS